MPITFKPASLHKSFIAALRALDQFAEITLDSWHDLHDPDFDFADPDRNLVITKDLEFTIHVAGEYAPSLSVSELIALADELPKSKVIDRQTYVAPTRAYVRVEASNQPASQFVAHISEYPVAPRRFSVEMHGIAVSLVNGFTPFAIHMMKAGEHESDVFPTFDRSDLFVELTFPASTKEAVWRALVPAFLFEVDDQTGMGFAPTKRMNYDDIFPDSYDEDEYIEEVDAVRLRPLMSGPGLESLLRLYGRAIGREQDPEQHLVGFVKVIEYVSATVVNTERNAQVRKRLLSTHALEPDARFIGDLVQLVESLRNFKKDSEAVRLTIEVCCDAVELAQLAPPSLRQLASIQESSSTADKERALKTLSAMLSATRNMFSHAKANYTPTGDECPEPELAQLTACARSAAQQCIRWYAHSDISLRIAE